MNKESLMPKDFTWDELFEFLKDEIPREHYHYVKQEVVRMRMITQMVDNEICNTLNYYGKNIPDTIRHHVEQLLRIKFGKSMISKEYKQMMKKCKHND